MAKEVFHLYVNIIYFKIDLLRVRGYTSFYITPFKKSARKSAHKSAPRVHINMYFVKNAWTLTNSQTID